MRKESIQFFEKLCNAPGVSGFEREPVRLARDYVKPYCDKMESDKLGSMTFSRKGQKERPVIFLPGHADEIGFLVSAIHDSGFLKFHTIGGWPDQVLLGQRVRVLTKDGPVPGLIASKPPHLMSDEEKKKMVSQKDMFIDICCSNADEARAMGVRVGDAVVADSTFSLIEKARYKDGKKSGKATLAMGKAFDNRAGLFIAVEVLRTLAKKEIDHPNTVVAGATTMEELGLRGATTSGYMVEPDVCMALDVGIAGDVPGIEKHQSNTALGSGVSITTYDSGMIPNQALKELVIETAEKENIPHVLTSLGRGTTDAAAVHKTKTGCPSIYLGIPTRHIHSHAGIIDLHDIQACIDLVVAVVQRLDKKTVQSLTEI